MWIISVCGLTVMTTIYHVLRDMMVDDHTSSPFPLHHHDAIVTQPGHHWSMWVLWCHMAWLVAVILHAQAPGRLHSD